MTDSSDREPSLRREVVRATAHTGWQVIRGMALARIDSFLALGYVGVLAIGSIVVFVVVSVVVGGATALLIGLFDPEPGGPWGTLIGIGFLVFWVGGVVGGIIWLARKAGRRMERTLARASQTVHALAGDDGGGYESEAQERRRRTLQRRQEALRAGRSEPAANLAELDARHAPRITGGDGRPSPR